MSTELKLDDSGRFGGSEIMLRMRGTLVDLAYRPSCRSSPHVAQYDLAVAYLKVIFRH